jgi:stage V sporulation protein G
MKITRMTQLPHDGNGKLAAFFDVQTDDGIVIKGFRLFNGPKGKFVSPPSDKGKDGKYYDSVILPRDIKDKLQKIAIDEYGK